MRKRNHAIRLTILFLFLLTLMGGLSLALFSSYQNPGNDKSPRSDTAATPPSIQDITAENEDLIPSVPFGPAAEYTPTEPFEYPITLMAVGDNLMHMGVVYTGRQDDGSYNFECLYESISDFLDIADIKIINQETVMAGNQKGFSGYPLFNSPTEVADGIDAAGFNVVLQSSNHSYDQGIEGIDYCVSVWKNHPDVLMVGLHDGEEKEQIASLKADGRETEALDQRIPLLTIDDVTFAVLNYTYGPNMGAMPSALQGRLDVLCDYNAKSGVMDFTTISPQVLEEIKRADELADAVIVCPHWGTEYSTSVSSYQKKFAEQMAEAGADLIIGAHPHVVEPVEWIKAENGNEALCFYSLGNYVSTQKDPISMLEAMAWVTFIVKEDGGTKTVTVSHDNSGAIPLVLQYRSSPVRIQGVYPLEDYTEELAAAHGIRGYGYGVLHLSDLQKWSEEILGDFALPVPY